MLFLLQIVIFTGNILAVSKKYVILHDKLKETSTLSSQKVMKRFYAYGYSYYFYFGKK